MRKRLFLIGLLLAITSTSAWAASEQATFGSFYDLGSHLGWIAIIGGVVFAIGAGAAIFFSGGAATPGVAAVGSWIGSSFLGLSGVAATNAGLALLGGGSLAAGGFGMAGGAAVISAAFAFSTGLVVDVTANSINSHFEQQSFYSQAREHMVYLPVGKIASSDYKPIEASLDILKNINDKEPLSSNNNQTILKSALVSLENLSNEGDPGEVIRAYTLKSLLDFDSQDFSKAKDSSQKAIILARNQNIRRTMPAFIYAASSTADHNFDKNYDEITDKYFSYSVLAEPDNKLIPVLFGSYFNLVSMRFSSDPMVSLDWVSPITSVAERLKDDDIKKSVYKILIANYFILLKQKQQFIYAVSATEDKKILSSKKTPLALDATLKGYDSILSNINTLINKSSILNDDKEISKYVLLYKEYNDDGKNLQDSISKFKKKASGGTGLFQWLRNSL